MNKDFHYLTQEETKRLLAPISSKRVRPIWSGELRRMAKVEVEPRAS